MEFRRVLPIYMGATIQGFRATVLNTAPQVWPLTKEGYAFDDSQMKADPMRMTLTRDLPVVTMDQLKS